PTSATFTPPVHPTHGTTPPNTRAPPLPGCDAGGNPGSPAVTGAGGESRFPATRPITRPGHLSRCGQPGSETSPGPAALPPPVPPSLSTSKPPPPGETGPGGGARAGPPAGASRRPPGGFGGRNLTPGLSASFAAFPAFMGHHLLSGLPAPPLGAD